MGRTVIGLGTGMITEVRREPLFLLPLPRRRRGALLLAVLLVGGALFNVWLAGHYYRAGYAVSAALEQRRSLSRDRDLLNTEILTLRSPARIEAIARAELKMVDPRTDRMIRP